MYTYHTHKINKAVYIGAGADVDILDLYCQTMICIDSQPKDECPVDPDGREGPTGEHYDPDRIPCHRPSFLAQLEESYRSKGFRCTGVNSTHTYITFEKGQRTVKYYYSVAFPYQLTDRIKTDIQGYDMLICDGYLPHKCILDYTTSFRFVGSNMTLYLHPDTDDQLEKTDMLDWELKRDSSKVTSWLGICRTHQGRIIDHRVMRGIGGYTNRSMFPKYTERDLDDDLF